MLSTEADRLLGVRSWDKAAYYYLNRVIAHALLDDITPQELVRLQNIRRVLAYGEAEHIYTWRGKTHG